MLLLLPPLLLPLAWREAVGAPPQPVLLKAAATRPSIQEMLPRWAVRVPETIKKRKQPAGGAGCPGTRLPAEFCFFCVF